jgi:hypothetical protein
MPHSKRQAMKIIKYLEGRSLEPNYAAFIRQDSAGHILINVPVDKPYGKREAKWLDPLKIVVIWLREFNDAEIT